MTEKTTRRVEHPTSEPPAGTTAARLRDLIDSGATVAQVVSAGGFLRSTGEEVTA